VEKMETNLPIITASSAADLIISQTLSEPSLVAALDIIKRIGDYNLNVHDINIMSKLDIRVSLDDDKIAQFTSDTPIENQLHRLQLILSQTTMNAAHQIIDVRYDKPAIKQSF
jgi:hypothetical protein